VQLPQSEKLVRSVSQPLLTTPSQSPKAAYLTPLRYVWVAQLLITHALFTQLTDPTSGRFEQLFPHAPQLAGSDVISTPPEQGDQLDSTPLLQVLVDVPVQLHVCVSAALPQFCPMHPMYWQFGPQVFVPPEPQPIAEFGAHAPWFAQGVQLDHIPVLGSHVRVCVPQLPQPCEAGPVHV